MTTFLVALVLLALTLMGVAVRKTYYHLPVKELKRRAVKHDSRAAKLYSAVAYGRSLRVLLWLYIGLTTAATIILLSRSLPVWLSLLVVGPLLWLAFSFMPATKVSSYSMNLTLYVTPLITWILGYLHPSLSSSTEKIEKRLQKAKRTKLFEKDDLIHLIEEQQNQQDSRFTKEELEIARRALQFGDHKVSDILIPAKSTKTILSMDHLGPVLIDEIYQSKQKYILVCEKKKGPFVGILEAENLGLHSQGLVHNLMRPTVYYLHEDDTLSEALKAFFVTNFPVFVVVNEHEEFAGIVTVEEILKKLMGHIPGDEFSEYTNPSAVANRHNPAPEIAHNIDNIPEDS